MPQTMLAILALTIMTTFALGQHRARVHLEKEVIANEIATQATAVAVDRLAEIGAMAYDQSTAGQTRIYAPTSLTLPVSFMSDAQGDDVDDFNQVTVEDFRVTVDQQIWYDVITKVEYVDEDDPEFPSLTPTKFKKATVMVIAKDTLSINTPGGIQVPDTIRMAQVYSCGSWCDW